MSGSRPARIVALVSVVAALGAACGGNDTPEGPSAATVTIKPASYEQRPAPTTVGTGPQAITVDGEGRTEQVQEYVVQEGEYPSTIADKFDVSLEDLMNINDWTLDGNIVPEFEGTGSTVDIPPGGLVPVATTTTPEQDPTNINTTTSSAPPSESTEQPTEEPPDEGADESTTTLGDRCTPGSYTIVATDNTRQKVADRFDVTVEALDAANAGTPGYGSFYAGLQIVIPPAADC